MNELIDLYSKQLLWGTTFLNRYAEPLQTLFHTPAFMSYMNEIKAGMPFVEDAKHIEDIKKISKTSMYETNASQQFDALREIVNDVASEGCAKNSAYISVYLAMRIFSLQEEMSARSTSDLVNSQKTESPTQNEYDFRLKWPAEYRCEDGHYVRSKNEMLVDNWLYSKGICHAYEKAIFGQDKKGCYCSDFYVPSKNMFIEIWGLNDSSYLEKRQRKADFYHKHGFNLLEISGDDVKNMDDKLSAAFCAR